ncbi:MAG: PEP-CTERM sorting domain-containing protein [Phycisphaerae bacterium]|nr:PEP-CTERM sorting domain-containing protein [Phycisphaerae bacterium]NIP52946.1 PEP-CTERM sorting domain-containing protein [Phycisphaerae bacterium]NIS51997.1 PEP-CTERM sorting domain-containing protein [Phycisphaerae bacterium]NIU09511.1 PEP-CTERM sorting domain-containing protein [Phycisphaerae bacterium]NIU58162.1 PEP-CTERM sorting domain-containing protein [Phycisphaerae bacterium]
MRAEVTSAVPEPATVLLFALSSLFLTRRRR